MRKPGPRKKEARCMVQGRERRGNGSLRVGSKTDRRQETFGRQLMTENCKQRKGLTAVLKAVSKEVKVAACQGTHPLRELERRAESQGLSLEKHPETK